MAFLNTVWRERLKAFAPVFIWVVVILILGSDKGSMSETSSLIRPVLRFFFPSAPEETLRIYHGHHYESHDRYKCFLHFLDSPVSQKYKCHER